MYIPFIFLAFLFYWWLLFKYPEIALFISFLIIINCFSMINEDLLRIPYAFRIRDVFFISTFFPLIMGIYKGDKKIKYVLFNPIARGIFLILFLALAQIFITKWRFPEESFSSIVRMGRRYFYYAIFFPAFYILSDKDRLRRFAKVFTGSIVIFCFMYIIQFIIGPAHKIFLEGTLEYQVLQGFRVTRMYIPGVEAVTLILLISFMLFLFHNKFKHRVKNMCLMTLCTIQTLATFGRAHFFGVITGILFGIACAKGQSRFKKLLKMFLFFLLILILAEVTSSLIYQQETSFIKAISTRVISTYEALVQKEDTFYFRIEDSLGRIGMIKENLLLGIGFVHDESKLFAQNRGFSEGLRTSDSGTVTLLLDFGISGFIWLLTMATIFFRRSIHIYKRIDSQFYRSVILGIIAFFFGRLFSFITLADFVVYDGIVILTLSLTFIEAINYQNMRHRIE